MCLARWKARRFETAFLCLLASALAAAPARVAAVEEGSGLPIFADSFESGDVCGWSSSVPPAGTPWYQDADQDGFGDPDSTLTACMQPAGYVANSDDCDDTSSSTFPGAAPLDSPTACMADADGDDFGSSSPPGGVTAGTDCDDASAATFPGAAPADSPTACMADADEDDYGSSTPPGGVTAGTDCDDANLSIHPGVTDDPDATFTDQNCDGIDGDVTRAAFVAPTGVDQQTCTIGAPCATVAHAAAVAAADPQLDQVYIAAGTYPEILDLPDGLAFFGGYDSQWQRAERTVPGHTAAIVGAYDASADSFLAVRADTVTASFADLVIQGPDATGGGPSSLAYSSQAVHASQSTLTFSRVTFAAGAGEDGAAGSNGTAASATAAQQGGTGQDGDEDPVTCSTARHVGGIAGTNPSCSATGGAGGAGGSKDTDCACPLGTCCDCSATPGLAGAIAGGHLGGSGGATCITVPPGTGIPGGSTDGNGGSGGGLGGTLVAGEWHGMAGGAGGVGLAGGGGSGGGGAGGCDNGTDDAGPGGGGGGAGGCPAPAAGSGGRGGGGSFGIVALAGSLSVHDSLFQSSSAGNGGSGGTGAAGQPGGAGGPGGAHTSDTVDGATGGAGGRGGHSGGGGGGTGGRACGILDLGTAVDQSGNGFSGGAPGAPGSGGSSPGQGGLPGGSGSVGNVCTCVSTSDC